MKLKEASRFRTEEQYQKAVELYNESWAEHAALFNDWDIWSYAFSLFKLQKYEESLDICREGYKKNSKFEMINSLYARNIFYTQFKVEPVPHIDILEKAIDAIFQLSPPYVPYSVSVRAILEFPKLVMKQNTIPWDRIEKNLEKLQPDLLDDAPFTFKNESGKKVDIASDKEKWYANMIRVKAGLNKSEELLELVKETKRLNLKFHYNNDIWFARKEAFAHHQLGNTKKAIAILRKLIVRKSDWFLIYDLAKLIEGSKEKLKLLAEAALKPGPAEMKLNLYYSLYELLIEKEEELAEKHLQLIVAIRNENGWDIPQEILLKLPNGVDENAKIGKLLKELRPKWKEFLPQQEILNGHILTVFPNGNAGFIKSGKESYFFTKSDMKEKEDINKGTKVSFSWKESFDKKKNKVSKQAINISVLKN